MTSLARRTVLVGLSGGIACYKVCEVVRQLARLGATTRVIMTENALQFVTPLTLQTLSGSPVHTRTFDLTRESEIGHIDLADSADALVIAPATANVLAKCASGIADDLLTTVALATKAPLLIAPAMNVRMWEHPATQENVAKLAARGARVVGPASGSLACGHEGTGRLAEPSEIIDGVLDLLTPKDLIGERIVISAGPTQEAIDPVRFLSNRSSGKMGYAVAYAARRRGAQVTLVTGPVALPAVAGVTMVAVESAAEMERAISSAFDRATALVMAAAVADYRPRTIASQKIKKSAAARGLELVRTRDILAAVGRRKGSCLVVGFAAETHDLVEEARRKLREKHCDLVVANDVTQPGAGFGSDTNIARLFDAAGLDETLPILPKAEVAERILDWILRARTAERVTPGRDAGQRVRRRLRG